MRYGTLALALALSRFPSGSWAQDTWCGKHYQKTQPIVPPGGHFPTPATSPTPLLAFRCGPGLRPYLAADIGAPATLLVDALVTHAQLAGATPLPHAARPGGTLSVTATVDGRTVARGAVPLNASKAELPLSLEGLAPRAAPYELRCTATYERATFGAAAALALLPDPRGRSATKMDLKTGALLAKPADGSPGPYAPVFSLGYYTDFGSYLATNLSALDDIKAGGFTIVHPIPTFDNLTALALVLDRMEELGLYLMYDMRWTYLNLTAVHEEVERIKSRPNLLLWYTADEPDGWADARNGTTLAYDLINKLDQGYHPVSLVLNCQDYYYPEYSAGADILLQDTYVVGNNVTYSTEWDTPCTPDYGDCGCDNCEGYFEDISDRMDQFAERNEALGWELTKSLWAVPQAFGESSYWKRRPTGKEWMIQAVLGINHGAKGVVSWNDPTSPDIKASSSLLAKALPRLTPFLFSHTAAFTALKINRVDVGVWRDGAHALVLATNLNYFPAMLDVDALGLGRVGGVEQVLDGGAKEAKAGASRMLVFEETGTGAWIIKV